MNRQPLLLVSFLLAAAPACSSSKDAQPAAGGSAAVAAPSVATPGGTASAPAAAGPRAEGEFWAVALEAPDSPRAGEPAEARVKVFARGGYHVNEEYPMSFRPAGAAAAGFSGERVALKALEKVACGGGVEGACQVTAPLPFVPRAPGEVRLDGTVAFSVCTAERCLIEKVPLAVTVAAR